MKLVRPATIDDDVLISTNVAESETLFDIGHTYSAADAVYVIVDNVHQKFTSVAGSNIGHEPTTDAGVHWTANGATNRWAMFDKAVQTQTTHNDSVAVELEIPGRVDTVALLNLTGSQAHIVMTDDADGVVFDETYSLVSPSGITDWAAYFREPIERLSDLIVSDLPPYAGATLDVTVAATGEVVGVGALICGQGRYLGGTRWSPQIGIQDYSVKTTDEFGNYVIVERAFAKRGSFDVLVDKGFVDQLQTLLAGYRATPILYIGDPDYASTAIYGFYKDFNVEIAYPDLSLCSIEIEGLT